MNSKKNSVEQLKRKMKARRNTLPSDPFGSAEKDDKATPAEACLSEEKTLSRRDVLRGALAVSCSLLMPITFFSAPAAGADTAPDTAPTKPKKTKKISKKSVKYQYKPNGKEHCGNCVNFIAPSACKRVAGKIDPNGWCVLWGKPA